MARYRCMKCKIPGLRGQFREFEADVPLCDKCGNVGPGVVPLIDVHYLVADDAAGQVEGRDGGRYRVACDSKRDVLATMTEHYSASDVPAAVSCPSCRGTPDWQNAAQLDRDLKLQLAVMARLKAQKKG